MTVKELEQTLDMTRANIRFYEREGLLSPQRLENGYRDYTEADLATLRKIQLLRQLQFDLPDIRAIQTGTKDLTAALGERAVAFTRDLADLEAARTLCRQMAEEGVRYADLDAGRYLAEMDRLAQGGTRFPTLQADALPTVGHPWVRFFARSLDLGLCGLLLDVLAIAVLRIPVRMLTGTLPLLAVGYLAWLVLLGVESVLLATWGNTPGKWLFGLKVRDAQGKKLTLSAAWARTAGVFQYGEGFGIPIYNLVRNWKSYTVCSDGEALSWEEGLSYTMRDRRALGGVVYVLARGAMVGLSVLLVLGALVPRSKLPLTVADFSKSYNDTAAQYDTAGSYILRPDGRWDTERQPSVYLVENGVAKDSGPTDFSYTLDGGHITAVAATTNQDSLYFMGSKGAWDINLVLTLLGAQPEVGPLSWSRAIQNLPKELNRPDESWSVSYYGLDITNEVSYSGYEILGDIYLFPIEGETQTYHRVFTVRLTAA